MKYSLQLGAHLHEITLRRDEDQLILVDGEGVEHCFDIVSEERGVLLLEHDGVRHRIAHARDGHELCLQMGATTRRAHFVDEEELAAGLGAAGDPVVRAPMPGRVIELLVATGDTVVQGQGVVRVEAMKMEVELSAAMDGSVSEIHVEAGQLVNPEAALVTILPTGVEGDEG